MDYKIQLLSFAFSFLYGLFFYYTGFFNYHFIKKSPILLQYLISFVYILDIVLLYILILYKINYGVVHVYFLIFLFLGFLLGGIYQKSFQKKCQAFTSKLKKK